MLRLAIAFLALAPATYVAAQPPQRCGDYVGTVVQPITIDTAIAQLAKLPKVKGEYETAAAFAARQAAALPGGAQPLIVAKALDLTRIRYDADWQTLDVGLFAFDNLSVRYDELFGYGTPYDGKVAYSPFGNIDVVISERESATKGYVGQSAFGARVSVTGLLRVTKAIFDREAEAGHADLLPNGGTPSYSLGTLSMAPDEARRRKPTLSGAFVILPKWPYVASGVKHWAPSIDMPEDTTQRVTTVVADIRCALLLDGAHKVLAAYEAR